MVRRTQLSTDNILTSFLDDEPQHLVALQKQHWIPLLEWATETFGVQINTSKSYVLERHPRETIEKFATVLDGFDEWQMAGALI